MVITSSVVSESRSDYEGFVTSTFCGIELVVCERDGFFNATKMCQLARNIYSNFVRSQKHETLDKTLTLAYGSVSWNSREHDIWDSSPISGTYCHPIMFLAVAMWCSHEFYVKAAVIVNAFFNKSAQRRRLMEVNDESYKDTVIDVFGHIRHIRYAGFSLIVDSRNWFNATKFCSANGKHIFSFERNKNVQELLGHLKGITHENPARLYAGIEVASDCYGTYYHPILFLRLAAWVSDEFYVKASQIVLAHFTGDEQTLCELADREITNESTTMTMELDAPIAEDSHIIEEGEHDSSGRVVCRSYAMEPADNFAAPRPVNLLDGSDSTQVQSATSAIDPVKDEVSDIDISMHSADLTSNSPDGNPAVDDDTDNSKWNARAFTHLDDCTGNKTATEKAESAQLTNTTTERPSRIIWDFGDDSYSCESVQSTTKLYTEDEVILIRQEHEILLNRVVREKDLEKGRELQLLERQRFEEVQRIQQQLDHVRNAELQKSDELRTLELKKSAELEDLRVRFENLQLERERERVALLKRAAELSPEALRRKEINRMANKHGIERLECVLLVYLKDNTLYAFRRQFFALIPTVADKLPQIRSFVSWFITNNSVQDFNRCKDRVRLDAKESQATLKMTQNSILVTDGCCVGNIVQTTKDVLRLMGLIEADVTVLQDLFDGRSITETGASSVLNATADETSTGDTLRNVYRWVIKAHDEFERKGRRKSLRRSTRRGDTNGKH